MVTVPARQGLKVMELPLTAAVPALVHWQLWLDITKRPVSPG